MIYQQFPCQLKKVSLPTVKRKDLFMKTLYVSDLDGTLLRKNETISSYTIKTINTLTSSGLLFSYATARSLNTSKKVTEGLNTHFPLIIYNGAFVKDNVTEEILIANYFEDDIYEVLKDLFAHEIYPIIYSYQNDIEKFSYIPAKATSGMLAFLTNVARILPPLQVVR